MMVGRFEKLFDEARRSPEFEAELAVLEFTEELNRMMAVKGISRAELARRLGTSQAYITKLFKGDANFTVETMARLCRAVEARLHVHISDGDCRVRWIEIRQRTEPRRAKRFADAVANDDFQEISQPLIGVGNVVCSAAA